MRKFILAMLAAFTAAGISAYAQNISFRAGSATLLYDGRYYPGLFAEKTPTFPSLNLKIGWEDHSGSAFSEICKYPEYGIAFDVECLGDALPAVGSVSQGMSNVYSAYGYFERSYFKTDRFSFGYTAGLGVGIVPTKLYDNVLNPSQIMMSIPVNGFATLGINAEYNLNDKYDIGLSAYFNHSSNGAVNFQNKGYNGYGVGLSVSKTDARYTAARRAERSRATKPSYDDGFRPHFQFDLQASGGVMAIEAVYDHTFAETGLGGNVRKPKYSVMADCMYKYSRVCASGLGFDLFMTPFCDIIAENDGKGIAYEPLSYGISARHEFTYNNLRTMVGVGRYLHDNDGLAQNKILYQFVNVKYAFPQLDNAYVGVILKAHKFKAAESVQICLGKSF